MNYVLCCIKNINELIKLYVKKNENLKKNEKNFFHFRFIFLIKEIKKNLILLNKNQIYKISKKILNKSYLRQIDIQKNNTLKNFFYNSNIYKFLLVEQNKEKEKIFKVLKKISNKKIIIYCAGSYSKIILRLIKNFKIKVKFICDSNLGFKDKEIYKYRIKSKVYLSNNIQDLKMTDILILNSNLDTSKNIKKDLIKTGFLEKKIFYLGH